MKAQSSMNDAQEARREDAMRTKFVGLLLATMTAMTLAGCSQVQEPWDNTGYFEQERVRSVEQQKALQERAIHGETDREMGRQQLNRT
jgi:hypothetical protein